MIQQVQYDIMAELRLPNRTIILKFNQIPNQNIELLSKKEIYREIVYIEKIIYDQKLNLFRLVKKQILCQNYNTYNDVKILLFDEPESELEYQLLQCKELLNINYETDRGKFNFVTNLQYKIRNLENKADEVILDIESIEIKNKEQSQIQNGNQTQRSYNQFSSSRISQQSQENLIENSCRVNVKQKNENQNLYKLVSFNSEQKHEYNERIQFNKKFCFSGNDILDLNINLRKFYRTSEQIQIDVQKIESSINIVNVQVYVGFQFSFKAEYDDALPIGILDFKKLESPYIGKTINLQIPQGITIPPVYESTNINVKHFVIINVEFQNSLFLSQYPNIDVIFPIVLFKDDSTKYFLKNFDNYFLIQKSIAKVEFTPKLGRPEYSQLLNLQQNQ